MSDDNVVRLDDNLYNIVHGTNAYADMLLELLGLKRADTGRFRDCFMQADRGELEIVVYTRNGNGNRADHAAVTEKLRAHPHYKRDYDAKVDATFAAYIFDVPPGARGVLADTCAKDATNALPASHDKRAQEFEQKMASSPDDPEVQRVAEYLKPYLERIAVLHKTSRAVGLLDKD